MIATIIFFIGLGLGIYISTYRQKKNNNINIQQIHNFQEITLKRFHENERLYMEEINYLHDEISRLHDKLDIKIDFQTPEVLDDKLNRLLDKVKILGLKRLTPGEQDFLNKYGDKFF